MTALSTYETLTEVAPGVLVRDMLTIDSAIDLFLDRDFADKTRKDYRRILDLFADQFERNADIGRAREEHCLRFLARYNGCSAGYRKTVDSTVRSFFGAAYKSRWIKEDPMARVPRPRGVPSDQLDVVTVSEEEVGRMLAAAEPWTELLCLTILIYLGPRRGAAARLRLRDYDRENGLMCFREKGSKVIRKPVPHELAAVLEAAIAAGAIVEPDDYLIPPQGPLSKSGDRCDRVIWRVITKLARDVGVRAHVHSLRAAFAVFFLRTHGRDIVALQKLMGHSNIETTMVYLRRMDKRDAMESVRDLSWGSVVGTGNYGSSIGVQFAGNGLADSSLVGAEGFEPSQADSWLYERLNSLSGPERLH